EALAGWRSEGPEVRLAEGQVRAIVANRPDGVIRAHLGRRSRARAQGDRGDASDEEDRPRRNAARRGCVNSLGYGSELARLDVGDGLLDLADAVHHEGAVLDDGLADRLPREDDDMRRFGRRERKLRAVVAEQDELTGSRGRGPGGDAPFRDDGKGVVARRER